MYSSAPRDRHSHTWNGIFIFKQPYYLQEFEDWKRGFKSQRGNQGTGWTVPSRASWSTAPCLDGHRRQVVCLGVPYWSQCCLMYAVHRIPFAYYRTLERFVHTCSLSTALYMTVLVQGYKTSQVYQFTCQLKRNVDFQPLG